MKKILTVFIILLFGINSCFAASKKQKDYFANFAGEKYQLLYSVKNPEFGGYLNEYYKRGETYNIWSEMYAVHHFPNAYSPIDRIKSFREYLGSMNCPSAITFDDKHNSAIIDFIIINDKKLPIILEFNVFKYQKSDKCGSVALQYTKRYAVTTAYQLEDAKRYFEKNRKKILKQVKNVNIPEIITEEIDKCKVDDIKLAEDTKEEKIESTVEEAVVEAVEELTESVKESTVETNAETTIEEVANHQEQVQEAVVEAVEEISVTETDKEIQEPELPAVTKNTLTSPMMNDNGEMVPASYVPIEAPVGKTINANEDNVVKTSLQKDKKQIQTKKEKTEKEIKTKHKKEKVKKTDKTKKEKAEKPKNEHKAQKVKQVKNPKKAAKMRVKEAAKNLEQD